MATSSISSISFIDFECFKNVEYEVSQFTAFVGKNNTGKTTLVKALDFVLGGRAIEKSFSFKYPNVELTVKLPRNGNGNVETKTFRRCNIGLTSKFFIDGSKCSSEKYKRILKGINIDLCGSLIVNHESWKTLPLLPPRDLAKQLERFGSDSLNENEEERKKELRSMLKEINKNFKKVSQNLTGSLTIKPNLEYKSSDTSSTAKIQLFDAGVPAYLRGLGGGQVPIASLAFMIAVNLWKKTPFMIIDSMAADIDRNTMVELIPKLVRYSEQGLQIIGTFRDNDVVSRNVLNCFQKVLTVGMSTNGLRL